MIALVLALSACGMFLLWLSDPRDVMTPPPTDNRSAIPCGYWDGRGRTQLGLREVQPDRFSLRCRLGIHQMACCPNHSTYVWSPDHKDLLGIVCERCGGLIGRTAA